MIHMYDVTIGHVVYAYVLGWVYSMAAAPTQQKTEVRRTTEEQT